MAGELERFLQEAAERLAQKLDQEQARRKPPRPQPIRQAERARVDPQILDAEIIEEDVVADVATRQQGPNPLSNIDTRPSLARRVGLADEKMAAHVHASLDHDVVKLKDSSAALNAERTSATEAISQVERRERVVNPLLTMLRRPETLRAAFIASQIFNRKF